MRRVLGTAIAAVLVGAMGWIGPASAAITAADLPSSMHGAVETTALTVGNGAAALFADPSTAYAYSTLDYDNYGEGSVSFTMTARGANLSLGTIPYAVIWAAPECRAEYDGPNGPCVLSGQIAPGVAPNTGLHEAKGFPAYAEALYPPPPADSGEQPQDRVYKCVINKDGPGAAPTGGKAAEICKTSDAIPLTAWAEAIGDEYRATGFSRDAGADIGLVKVANNESYSDIRPIGGGKVVSEGYSVLQNISLLDGQITIDSVKSAARIVSASSGEPYRATTCNFAGLKIEGQAIASDGTQLPYAQVEPLLDNIAASTGYKVELVPPTLVSRVEEGAKQFVSCTGFQIKVTDTHTNFPVPACLPVQPADAVPQCVPALANREELSFGRITVQQAISNTVPLDLGGTVDDALGSAGGGLVPGYDASAPVSDVLGADLSAAGVGDLGLGASGSLSGGGSGAGNNGSASLGTGSLQNASHRVNAASLGLLTAASSLAWLVGVLVLVGVVNSLATGRRLRLPGF
jgi:hypothetical protein